MIKWHLEKRKVSELKNWEKNPRTISEKAFKELEKSVDALGNFEPLVVNIDGTVIAGNQRLRLEMKKGNNEVDVYVPERELSEEEVKKIGVISNRHSGEWDMDILANEFEDVLKDLGFDDLLPELVMEVSKDDYEEPEQLPSKVQLGEVWQLGRHRLMCGDSTKIEDVEKLMNGEKADMVFTDPPYGIEYDRHISDKKDFQKGIKNDNTSSGWLVNIPRGIPTYICTRWDIYPIIYNELKELGHIKNVIVWDKLSHGMGDTATTYAPSHEFIVYLANTDEVLSNRDRDIISVRRENGLHPTMKPVELIYKLLKNNSGDIILDLFGGSGSTLIACEQTNRVCYMMELDTHYSSVIIDRWETLTGKKAVKI